MASGDGFACMPASRATRNSHLGPKQRSLQPASCLLPARSLPPSAHINLLFAGAALEDTAAAAAERAAAAGATVAQTASDLTYASLLCFLPLSCRS